MIRRLLRKLISPGPAPQPPARPRPAPPPEPEPDEPEPNLEVEGPELLRWVAEGREPLLLDVREKVELEAGHALGALLIPMNEVPARLAQLPRDRTLVVYCAAGARSYGVAHYLREQGFPEAWSLAGGLGAWTSEGGAWTRPARGGRSLLSPARLTPEAARARGLSAGDEIMTGVIQEVSIKDEHHEYVVSGISTEGRTFRVSAVLEEELMPAPGRPPR